MTKTDPERTPQRASAYGGFDSVDLIPLVDACARGDRQAMERLYGVFSDRVFALMVRIVGRQDADDLTQQVFMKVYRSIQQFRGGSKFETWLYRLATNEALQHLRRQKQRVMQPLTLEPTAADDSNVLVASEELELFQIALSRINPELRAMLALKEEQQLSYRDIAEALGIPEGTVGSRLNRARHELRTELLKLGWDQDAN